MIYFIEDDANIRKLVAYALRSNGYEVEEFTRPSEFHEALSKKVPSLVLLDIMLPEEDGLEILKKLKKDYRTSKIPVIMVTAKGSEFDKVTGLDLGADDYIAKPFGIMELVSRVRAVLRRFDNTESIKEYRIGSLYVCPQKHIVKVGSNEIELSHKEYELLCKLVESEEKVVTRDELLSEIWGYEFDGESRTVDVHVRKLRVKLGDEAASLIETVKGVGYKIRSKDNE